MGLTLAEKVISEHLNKDAHAGEIVITKVDVTLAQDGTGPLLVRQLEKLGIKKVACPEKAVFFLDHSAPAARRELSNDHAFLRKFSAESGARLAEIGDGICHQVINEWYVNPGDILIGADSHTCTGGALCAFATGMGSTDVAIAMGLGKTWLRVPETFKIYITGQLPFGVYPKDLILYLIGLIGADGATYKALEYCGPTIENMNMNGRLTLANMAVEAGAKVGMIASDKITYRYLQEMGRPNKYRMIQPDPDAVYERIIEIDASKLEPVVSHPHSVDNVHPLSESKGIRVNQVFLGTCTNSRLEDWEIVVSIIKGRKKNPDLRFIAVPGSKTVMQETIKRGYYQTLLDFGAVIMPPGCGPCVGVHGGVPSDGEVVLATMNRNFRGRMGNPESFIYLGSPATIAATAITGEITDPREFLRPVKTKVAIPKANAKTKPKGKKEITRSKAIAKKTKAKKPISKRR